jgi:hypothetical protein
MRKSILTALVGGALVSVGMLQTPVRADTFSMAAGMQSDPGPLCYDFGFITPGVSKLTTDGACFNMNWVMPLYWRNFYTAGTNRTVQVRGQVLDSNSLLGCTLYVFDSNGTISSQAQGTFPVTGNAYGSISLTVNNVTSGSSSVVFLQQPGQRHASPEGGLDALARPTISRSRSRW